MEQTTFTLKEKQIKFLEFVKDLDEVKERGGVYLKDGSYLIGIDTINHILDYGTYIKGGHEVLNKVRDMYKDRYLKKLQKK